MKVNEHTALSTPKVLLVPYSEHHVPPYHEWMKDADLQAATASEPLTLEEEYAMQRSWRTDHDKLTFIICLPLPVTPLRGTLLRAGEHDAPEKMLGDINLFLLHSEAGAEESNPNRPPIGEIELMIARREFHRQGFGRSALVAFLAYLLSHWGSIAAENASRGQLLPPRLGVLRVKIQESNVGSIRLFESVGFARTGEGANFFGELELRWVPDVEWVMKEEGSVVELRYGLS